MFFSGVYQVVKIESSFSGGEFTQVLHCVRLNNQKGKGLKAILGKEIRNYFNKEQEKINKARIKKSRKILNQSLNKVRDDIINQHGYNFGLND